MGQFGVLSFCNAGSDIQDAMPGALNPESSFLVRQLLYLVPEELLVVLHGEFMGLGKGLNHVFGGSW